MKMIENKQIMQDIFAELSKGNSRPLIESMVEDFCWIVKGSSKWSRSYQGKQTGENSLLRTLAAAFQPGDVVLGDRYYGGWFDLALWRQRGVDPVVRLHQLRSADFRRGCRLGDGDHVVAWPKPAQPQWMDDDTYTQLPDWLVVREVAVRVEQDGFRTRALTVVTTLVDAVSYPAADLAELYRARWHAELDLRSLKITMSMDVLRCKTPAMVRKA